MNLLRGEIMQSMGKITGSKFKKTYYYKAKIVGKAPPTQAQTSAVRGYEAYLRILATIYGQLPLSGRYKPKGMSLLNWCCKQSKELLSQNLQYDGRADYHSDYGDGLQISDVTYNPGRGTAVITIIKPAHDPNPALDMITMYAYNYTGHNILSGVIQLPNPLQSTIIIPIPTGLDMYTMAWLLTSSIKPTAYSNAYVHHVTITQSDPPPPAAGTSRVLPYWTYNSNASVFLEEGAQYGQNELVKGKLGRKSRSNSRRKVEKQVDD
jgi:hypothetical protein